MGIASAVFWIVFGLLYILYQAYKEHPDETFTGVLLFVILGGGMIAWFFIFDFLLDLNIVAASIFLVVSSAILFTFIWKIRSKEIAKKKDFEERYNKALWIARHEDIDEEALAEWRKRSWNTFTTVYKNYPVERIRYRGEIDKDLFRDEIVDDYIKNKRVYEIMSELKNGDRPNE